MAFQNNIVQIVYYKSLYTTPSYHVQPKQVKYIEIPIEPQQTEKKQNKSSVTIVGKSKNIELINMN